MSVEDIVARFRIQLTINLPYYGEVIAHVPFLADTHIPTACTDGLSIRYNPAFLKDMTEAQMCYVLMHELFHILLMHSKRLDEKRPDLWNAACDMVINTMLDNMTPRLRGYGLFIERPADGIFTNESMVKSAEQYYASLLENNPTKQNQINFMVRKSWRQTDMHTCPVPNDLPSAQMQAGVSQEVIELIQRVQRMAQGDREAGIDSFGLPEQVFELAKRKPLNWKRILRDMMQEAENEDDSSWQTPERKYIHMDILLPGRCRGENDQLGEVWAFVDSSGSISREEMACFLNELWHILRQFPVTMNVAYWDTNVTDVYTNIKTEKKLRTCLPKHSGGTSMGSVYRYIAENRLRPDVLLILTDGYIGPLDPATIPKSLIRKTVIVLSTDRMETQMKQYGKVASL